MIYVRRDSSTRLLLGTRYALLRQEFLEYVGWQRETPIKGRKVLVTLGGSDPENVTLKVVRGLLSLQDLEAVVAIGGSNLNLESLKAIFQNCPVAIRLTVSAPA